MLYAENSTKCYRNVYRVRIEDEHHQRKYSVIHSRTAKSRVFQWAECVARSHRIGPLVLARRHLLLIALNVAVC